MKKLKFYCGMLGIKPSLFYFALLRLPRVDKHQKQSNGIQVFPYIFFLHSLARSKLHAIHSVSFLLASNLNNFSKITRDSHPQAVLSAYLLLFRHYCHYLFTCSFRVYGRTLCSKTSIIFVSAIDTKL